MVIEYKKLSPADNRGLTIETGFRDSVHRTMEARRKAACPCLDCKVNHFLHKMLF